MTTIRTWRGLTALVGWLAPFALATLAHAQDVRIVQTNSAGDNVHIIDPVTNQVVGEIGGIERAHGVAARRDGRLYVANEADTTVDIVDVKTLSVIKKLPLERSS